MDNIHYILDDDHNAVPVDLRTWGRWLDNIQNRIVAQDWPRKDVMVSTVFLGIDHSLGGEGPPLLFETMVFRGPDGGEEERYATWAEAEAGHKAKLKAVIEEAPNDRT